MENKRDEFITAVIWADVHHQSLLRARKVMNPEYEETDDDAMRVIKDVYDNERLEGEDYFEFWRRKTMEMEKERRTNFPYVFTFTCEYEGGKTSDAEFKRIDEFVRTHCKAGEWTIGGDSIGYSVTYYLKDPDAAMLFKLSFNPE